MSGLSRAPTSQEVAQWLGYTGLLPFYALAFITWSEVDVLRQLGIRGFPLYAGLILAFLAGTLWGAASGLEKSLRQARLVVSNALVILALVAQLFAPPLITGFLLLLAHALLLHYEISQAEKESWYLRLRRRLTALSAFSYGVWAAALM